MSATEITITLRPMTASDLDAVMAVDASGSAEPWSATRFQTELDNPLATVDIAEIDGQVAGYLCYWLVAGELEIHNIVTAPNFRRRGVARQLLNLAVTRSKEQGCERLLLEVRVGNEGAITLYRNYGFTDCGVRKGYYRDGEDALLMEMPI